MPPAALVFTLPLEDDGEEQLVYDEGTYLNVETDGDDKDSDKDAKKTNDIDEKSRQPRKKRIRAPIIKEKPPPFSRIRFTWRMIRCHILLFFALSVWFYAIFHVSFSDDQKEVVLKAMEFVDDWKQMAFFLGIYISFAVKKVSDVSSHIPPTDKIANLVSIAVKKNRNQKAIMKYATTSLAMVFSFLSPMVRKRLFCSEKHIKERLEIQSKKVIEKIEKKLLNINSSHFMPIKWTLHVIQEAHVRKEVDDRLFNTLINEINVLHANCDRLINLRHETFSWGITRCVMISQYCYFTVGAIRILWTGLTEGNYTHIIVASLTVNFFIFLAFLTIVRCAEQIVKPYNDEHDVFELNRILNEKLEVNAFVLNKECDLRKKIKNVNLLP